MEPDYKPLLRYVDAIPAVHQGQPVFLLKDPLGFIDEVVIVPQALGFLLSLMDGNHDLRDIQVEATRHFGNIVPMEEIIKFVSFLDERGLLWSENFEKLKQKAYEKWFSLKIRPMAHANQAYPLSASEAKFFVEEVLKLASFEENQDQNKKNCPRILIVPHIDIRAGAKAFAEGYARFKPDSGARIIIFGVGHHLEYPISVLSKDMATPFGIVRNDRGGLFYLTRSKKLELFPDHMAHKLEHSIEFQILFLHHILGEEFVVLPFLVGPLESVAESSELIDALVDGILELIDDRTYMVLGIDFCHLGLRYGDPMPVSDYHREKALETDRKILELTFKGENKDFLEEAKKLERMKICGISCLYILNKILRKGGFKGDYQVYHQEFVPFGSGSAVSVASVGANF